MTSSSFLSSSASAARQQQSRGGGDDGGGGTRAPVVPGSPALGWGSVAWGGGADGGWRGGSSWPGTQGAGAQAVGCGQAGSSARGLLGWAPWLRCGPHHLGGLLLALSRSRSAAGCEVTESAEAAGQPRRGGEGRGEGAEEWGGERKEGSAELGGGGGSALRRLSTLECWRRFPRKGKRLKGTATGSGHNLSFSSGSC